MWKTGIHWLMEEGVECMVELVNNSKGVVVITKSERESVENCVCVFNKIINCVLEAKAEFCHSIKPNFFLLNSTDEADYLREDNQFAMSEVEKALTSPHSKEIVNVVSLNGKGRLKRENILCLRKLTEWYSLFPIEFISVLHLLEDIVKGLYKLGLHLGISSGVLDALEDNFPTDVERRRRELVRVWFSSSLDPPCWWHLVLALRRIDERVLAEKIAEENSVAMQLQEKLLAPQCRDLKPDVEFLESFASVVGSKWPSLAASLSLSDDEMEEVKKEGLSQRDHALRMLEKWVSREDATYGLLCQTLKTISLFHCTKQ